MISETPGAPVKNAPRQRDDVVECHFSLRTCILRSLIKRLLFIVTDISDCYTPKKKSPALLLTGHSYSV